MTKIAQVVLGLIATTVVLAPVAVAATSNTGAEGPVIPNLNVLSSAATSAGMRILYAPSEADDAAYRAAIAAITGGTVDYFDARVATPDLALLQQYECVHTWANSAYADTVAFGNNLADFVDGGGSAVLGVFSTYTTGNFLSGRIMTPGYSPVVSPSGTNHFTFSSYAGDGTTVIYKGVTAFGSVYRDFLTLQGNGIKDGSYLDGEIAHAYRPDFRVIYSNGGGAVPLGGTGDWPRLIANACAAHAARVPVPVLGLSTFGALYSGT